MEHLRIELQVWLVDSVRIIPAQKRAFDLLQKNKTSHTLLGAAAALTTTAAALTTTAAASTAA